MSKFNVSTIVNNDIKEFAFSGCIDDTLLVFFHLFPTNQPVTTIHLDEVNSINSTGIREWINLMQILKSSKIKLQKCPKVFIDQANMVKGFLAPNATVESFYVPYFSEESNLEKKILFERDKHYTDSSINFESTIVDGGVSYDVDIIPSKYFKFMKSRA